MIGSEKRTVVPSPGVLSIQMLPRHLVSSVRIWPAECPAELSEWRSIVGHADTARVLDVAHNRESVQLAAGDVMLVAQVVGGRLPEGATQLPPGTLIEWYQVEVGPVFEARNGGEE